jgi:Tol biopolymer transport system component
MPRKFLLLLLFCVVGAVAVCAPALASAAAPATFGGISADGSVVAFTTTEQLVPGDTDQELDVYVRTYDSSQGEYVTREVSIGPGGGNDTQEANYDGISGDGKEIFFSTKEALMPGETDKAEDVFVRNIAENRTLLVSAADPSCAIPSCGNNENPATFSSSGVAFDGDRAFFATTERLSSADQDNATDIYVRDIAAQTTTLVTAGDPSCSASDCGNLGGSVSFRGTDEAGDKAFFTSSETLSTEDADGGEGDIYERDLLAGRTYLVSGAGTCPNPLPAGQTCEPTYGGNSRDGSHVFFETYERQGGDTDSSQDVYAWSGGAPVPVSLGPDGGNGIDNATYGGTSANGSVVYFLTDERLDAVADTDGKQDVYRSEGGETTLVSAGEGGLGNLDIPASFNRSAGTGGTPVAVFSTKEPLVAADGDEAQDIYERVGETTILVSVGPEGGNGPLDATFADVSADGSAVFFTTSESLVAQDTDQSSDIYRWSEAGTELVSAGQTNGNGPYDASLHGVSSDGSKAFFSTFERLTEGDTDTARDLYSWNGSSTRLVSAPNAGFLNLQPLPPALEGTNPASPNASTSPLVFGQADAGALIKVYKSAGCVGEVVAQGTAAELASPGIPVSVAAGSTTFFRATSEVGGIVSDCSNAISYTQQNPEPPPPPPGEEGTGGTESGGGSGGTSGDSGTQSGVTGTVTGNSGATGGSSGSGKAGLSYLTPVPKVTFGPAAKTRLRRPTFRFEDATGQTGTKFFCRVDRQRWTGCTSPLKVKKVTVGRHVFSLKAVNAVGTPGAAPTKRQFKVVSR